jgi:hypothetical protein
LAYEVCQEGDFSVEDYPKYVRQRPVGEILKGLHGKEHQVHAMQMERWLLTQVNDAFTLLWKQIESMRWLSSRPHVVALLAAETLRTKFHPRSHAFILNACEFCRANRKSATLSINFPRGCQDCPARIAGICCSNGPLSELSNEGGVYCMTIKTAWNDLRLQKVVTWLKNILCMGLKVGIHLYHGECNHPVFAYNLRKWLRDIEE